MDETGYDCVLARRAPLQHLQRVPLCPLDGHACRGPDEEHPDWYRGHPGVVLPPAADRRGGRAARRALRRARQLGGRGGASTRPSSARSTCRSRSHTRASARASRSCSKLGATSASPGMGTTGTSTRSRFCRSRTSSPRRPSGSPPARPTRSTGAGEQGYSIPDGSSRAAPARSPSSATGYLRQLERHGHPTEGRTLPIARLIAVAETDAEAEEIARARCAVDRRLLRQREQEAGAERASKAPPARSR